MTTSNNPEVVGSSLDTVADEPKEYSGSENSLAIYLQQIGKIALLTREEEADLAKKVEAGVFARKCLEGDPDTQEDRAELLEEVAQEGEEAKAKMIEANLRLVVTIAKSYRYSELPFLDLIQEGNIGLFRAVEKFDYTRDIRFGTYATWWVRQAIQKAIHEKERLIRLPVHKSEEAWKLHRTERRLLFELGRTPSDLELAVQLMAPGGDIEEALENVQLLQKIRRYPLRLNMIVDHEDGTEAGDNLYDPDERLLEERVCFLNALFPDEMDKLAGKVQITDRNWKMVKARFGFGGGGPLSVAEVGRMFGMERERARQIIAQSLQKIRKHPEVMSVLRLYYE